MNTRVTEMLNIMYPIIQGGLAHLAYAELAAAVSEAGGLGQITAMSLPSPDSLRAEIQKVRTLTTKPFGVNFAIGQHDRPYEEMLDVAIEEGIGVISITGGNPEPLIRRTDGYGMKRMVLVAAVRQAQKAEAIGADAVMAVGQEGGGHLGRDDIGTFVLIPRVVDSVNIPVLASGGIGDGRGLLAALALGAEGVEMGTRFIATQECVHAHAAYKQALIQATEHDTTVIKRSLGTPARVVSTKGSEHIIELEKQGVGYEGLREYISGRNNCRFIYDGDAEHGFGWAGQVVGLIHDVPTVQELFNRMMGDVNEFQTIIQKTFQGKP
ncbi:nitronate monooxygenase [Brevibacillus laterosporus]|uniref:Probable nitronate monooxygenase n=1 Tax=Brevibacillus laterosporus TaxID=1465 RepID=A0A502IZP6_BRELA|nr:nitronate monooxygenase family protein [Brevibacillus laterosporus]QDX95229.1 nitronate monooxygenase [Brevibacillus laterosporus]RAP26874.1 Enoyl-[acyl-carrier-protein] reductase [Brevibacillus laterosporus]TPG69143.1 nitronate monooxygenase [Brevibacillus laterosporus]TPG90690.1 nitronate monooxygenase [Brevibacillus laterosporus]